MDYNMEPYISQREKINQRATQKGIKLSDIQDYFNRTLDRARRENPGYSDKWYQSLVEYCAWLNFFHGEPFPGDVPGISLPLPEITATTNTEPVVKSEPTVKTESVRRSLPTKTEPVVKSEPTVKTGSVRKIEVFNEIPQKRYARVDHSSLANRDWVHDRYDERLSRKGDFYRPNESKRAESSRRGGPSRSDSWLPEKSSREDYGRLSPQNLEISNPTRSSTSDSFYESQAHLIMKNTAALSIPPDVVQKALDDERARIKTSHPNKSSDWQKWATEWAVWSRFCTKFRFPGVEPLGKSTTSSTSSRDRADHAVKLAGSVKSPALLKRTETTEPVRSFYYPLEYQMQEKKMEDLAIKRDIRSAFFSFLQKARDQVRMEHPDCASEIRHYHADKMTWKKFFADLPFQGKEPTKGHSDKCRNRLKGLAPPKGPKGKAPTPTPTPVPTVQTQGFFETQPSLTMLAALGIARHSHNQRQGDDNRSIIMVGPKPVFGEAQKATEIFNHLIADNIRSVTIVEVLQCTFRYHRTTAGHLLLWATSDVNSLAAVDRGHAFLLGWITRALVSGMIRPFGYWGEMCRATFATIKFENPKKPHDFQAATACWDEYRNVTGSTLVDCLLVEEAAKGEGELRMVLDKVAEEVVTIKELLKRDRYRSSRDDDYNASKHIPGASGVSTGEKRKMDDEILPDANNKRLRSLN